MMKILKVNLKSNSYKILVGNDILGQLGNYVKALHIGSDALIITNPGIHRLWGKKIESSLTQHGFTVKFFDVPDGEKSKSLQTAFVLLNKIAAYDV